LVFVFLIQLVHWTTVSGELAAPTDYTTAVKNAVNGKIGTPGSPSYSPVATTCASGEADTRMGEVRAALGPTLGGTNSVADLKLYGGALPYFLANYLTTKDTTAAVDATKLDALCTALQVGVDAYGTVISSSGACATGTAEHGTAVGLVNGDKATVNILDQFSRYCTAAGASSAHALKFFSADYKYPDCSATAPGQALIAAIDGAIEKLRALTPPSDADRAAFFADPAAKAPYSEYCTKVNGLYNDTFTVYHAQTFDEAKCPAATLSLFYERIPAELVPGTKLACDGLLDPAMTGTIPPAPPTPAPTVAGGGGGNGSSFVKASFSFILFAVAIQKVWV
jgi:hypothetical protein